MSAEAAAGGATVATWNVHGGVGRDGRYSPARIAGVVGETGADVIALQEVGSRVPGDALLDALLRDTGFTAVDGWTCRRGECDFGNVLLSRFPVEQARRLDLSVGRREPRGALDVVLRLPQGRLRVIATHLGLWPGERRAQVEHILAALEGETSLPTVLAGDLNEWFRWGRPFRWLHRHFAPTPAPATFPSWRPVLPLDRLWAKPASLLSGVQVHRSTLARAASDHLPLVARLAMRAGHAAAPTPGRGCIAAPPVASDEAGAQHDPGTTVTVVQPSCTPRRSLP
jgi:endonuclease/exonuclease/phosphatase family metal-dependent hydrolase